MKLLLLTVSRAKSFRRCARHHLISYEQGFRPLEKSNPLAFGSLFHRGLEAWWRFRYDNPLGIALDEIRKNTESVDPFDLVKAEELLIGYHVRWDDEPLQVMRVEVEFELELRNPATGASSRTWRLGGKIDAIAQRDGVPWIVEHKTSSEDISPGSPYWQKLRLDAQVSTYLEGARALGFDARGCIYDVIAKPSLRPLQATPAESRKYTKEGRLYANQREQDETPEEYRERLREHICANPERYYQRGEVIRTPQEEQEAAYDLWQIARAIRDAETADRHPRNPDACFTWGRACEYFGVCCGAESLEDTTRFRKLDHINEELDNGSNASAGESTAAAE
jgi:hypothetical protein